MKKIIFSLAAATLLCAGAAAQNSVHLGIDLIDITGDNNGKVLNESGSFAWGANAAWEISPKNRKQSAVTLNGSVVGYRMNTYQYSFYTQPYTYTQVNEKELLMFSLGTSWKKYFSETKRGIYFEAGLSYCFVPALTIETREVTDSSFWGSHTYEVIQLSGEFEYIPWIGTSFALGYRFNSFDAGFRFNSVSAFDDDYYKNIAVQPTGFMSIRLCYVFTSAENNSMNK